MSKLIDSGAVATDFYMVAILDRPSNQNYSSRASAAAYCVADEDTTPDKQVFRRFHAALYAQHVLVRKDHLPKRRKRGCPFDRRQRKPILNDVRVSKSGLCAPSSVGFSYGAKQVAVEALVAAVMDDIFLNGLIGQTHEHPQPLFDASRGAEACERLLSASAAHEIIDCASFPEPEAEPLDVDN